MEAFSSEEIKGVINGLIAGLRSGDVSEDQIRDEANAEYRRVVNLGWADQETTRRVAEEIHSENNVAPPKWLLGGENKPEPKQVQF